MIKKIPVGILLSLLLVALVVGLVSTGWQFRTSGPETASSDDPVVATVGNRSITLREVKQTVAIPLYLADQQRNQLLQQATQNLIDDELLGAEASRKGISVGQLLDEASQSEAIARLADLPAPVKRLGPGQIGDTHNQGASLDMQEQARIRQALLVLLRRKTDVRLSFPDLEPPILAVSTQGHPAIGPDPAPVTIVEFSDFQCPYCQQSVHVLKELRNLYGDKIRPDPIIPMRCKRPKPPTARASKASSGSTMIVCLIVKRRDKDGISPAWRANRGCNRKRLRIA